MCEFFGVSRSAFYGWVAQMQQGDRDTARLDLVRQAWEQSRRTYGYRRVTLWLQQQGQRINHKAVLRLMQKQHIRSLARQPNPARRWHGGRAHLRYPNLLDRQFQATHPNQKWVTDITYIATQQGWAYLSAVKDLFDGFIIAHRLGRQNSLGLVLATLQQAQRAQPQAQQVMLHSDQGFQYTAPEYRRWTQQMQFIPSMSRRGNCWDNAPIESFFGQLKEELLRHIATPTWAQAQHLIADYVQFYNYERIQLKTQQTPAQTRGLLT